MEINFRFSADERFLQALIGLTKAIEAHDTAIAWREYDKKMPAAEKSKPLETKPVSAREERAINDMIAVPSQAEEKETPAEEGLSEDEVEKLRPKVAAFLQADKSHKAILKAWLDAHSIERVTQVKRADAPSLLELIGEKKEADSNA